MPSAKPVPIYQLKVTLHRTKPPIWRRVQVPATITLARLHHVIQIAMGWHGGHLHEFVIADRTYGPMGEYATAEMDESRARLNRVVTEPNTKIRYDYDFGDSWRHDIVLEKIVDPQPGQQYPICLTGKRACPPEDVGGVWGYANFVAVMADPTSEGHDDMAEWWGEDTFDPEAFNVEAINQQLAGLR